MRHGAYGRLIRLIYQIQTPDKSAVEKPISPTITLSLRLQKVELVIESFHGAHLLLEGLLGPYTAGNLLKSN